MGPKKILRTIESYLGLEHSTMPIIKEDRKYLRDIDAEGAMIKVKGEETIIIVKNKKNLYVLAEELTHFIDNEKSRKSPVKNDEDFFYNQALIEALGYYCSKIISPKRKPITPEKRIKKNISRKNWELLKDEYKTEIDDECGEYCKNRRAWHQIGYDLGQKVYDYVQRTGDKEPALSLIIKNRQEEEPFRVYKKILEEVTK